MQAGPASSNSSVAEPSAFAAFDVVVVGSSLGGIHALPHLLRGLPSDFPAAIAIVQHLGPRSAGALPYMLGRTSPLPVEQAASGAALQPGHVYVAPPDCHCLITSQETILLTRSAKVKFCRPAADPLFVSAAIAYPGRALGVVLSGANSDGAAGAQAIKWSGGMVLAQDEATSQAYGMPRAAIATGCVDLVLPLEAMSSALVALVMMRGAADYLRVPLHAA